MSFYRLLRMVGGFLIGWGIGNIIQHKPFWLYIAAGLVATAFGFLEVREEL